MGKKDSCIKRLLRFSVLLLIANVKIPHKQEFSMKIDFVHYLDIIEPIKKEVGFVKYYDGGWFVTTMLEAYLLHHTTNLSALFFF